MLEEGLAGFERARAELERRVGKEIEAVRLDASRRAEASAARVLERAEAAAPSERVVEEARQEIFAKTRELAVGERARVHGTKLEGVVLSLDRETVWLDVSGKRMRFARIQLEPGQQKSPARPRPAPVARISDRGETAAAPREVNVIGQRIEDAIPEIEKSLDAALLAGAGHLRVVHGHGTGRLRDAVREHFRTHPAVASLRRGEAREGGDGATIVELK